MEESVKTILVAGATGNTGRPLVQQLLGLGHTVRVIARASQSLPTDILEHPNITVLEASILDLDDEQMAGLVNGCHAVVSCLGHNMSFKGIFGEPKKLCTDATRRLCKSIEANTPNEPTKFILMSTVGVSNPDLGETRTWLERVILTLLRWLIPPQADNETAIEHLYTTVGRENRYVEWCSVRPSSLIDADVSQYEIKESPVASILNDRTTTRSNVAHFMTRLIGENQLWSAWKFKMPVIINSE